MLNICVYLRTKFQISSKILTSEEFYHIPRSTAKRTPKKPTQIKVMCSQKQLERRKKQIWQLSNFTKVASFIPCNYIQLTTFKWQSLKNVHLNILETDFFYQRGNSKVEILLLKIFSVNQKPNHNKTVLCSFRL